jgi:hypothetical protein
MAIGLIWALAGPIDVSYADCPGDRDNVIGKADSNSDGDNIQGIRTSIHTSDLNWQCLSVRSNIVWKDADDWVEVGWVKGSPDGTGFDILNQTPEVFVVQKIAGVGYNYTFSSRTPNPETDHTYKIANSNGDLYWRVEYDGDGLDNYYTFFRWGAYARTNSERRKPADNLWDHHDTIKICTGTSGGCDERWHDAAAYHNLYDDAGDYDFCRDSINESHVKGTC